ncbi:MAG: recombination protein RecR [Bacteroidetes bacterium]|jgi:recombination protein RecR|nr:recombination protein RecR [Bacteroidota bacterium]
MEFPSKAIQQAVAAFKSLPGIGNKTAVRLVLHLAKQEPEALRAFELAVSMLREHLRYCDTCFNLSDDAVCHICANTQRDHTKVCVVQDIRDVMAIESTGQYRGVFHVLGGLISPMDGVGPNTLKINELVKRVQAGGIDEVIFALSATMEGDTTVFYASKQIKPLGVAITSIAKGIAIGGELEFVDEVTLGRSIASRVSVDV